MGGRSGKTAQAVARALLPCQDRQQRPQAARPGWWAPRRHGPGDRWWHRRAGNGSRSGGDGVQGATAGTARDELRIEEKRVRLCPGDCCGIIIAARMVLSGAERQRASEVVRPVATSGDAGDQAEDAREACWAQGKWRSSTDSDALLSDRRGFHVHKRSSGNWIRPHRAIGARRVARRGSGPRHPSPDRRRYRACQG